MNIIKKVRLKDIPNLNLKGIEFVEVTEASTDDLKAVRLRDTVTGTEISFVTTAYSEFTLYAKKPTKKEKRFVLSAKLDGMKVTYEGVTEEEAKAKVTPEMEDVVITTTEVEVEE